jgi:hypothetical protein
MTIPESVASVMGPRVTAVRCVDVGDGLRETLYPSTSSLEPSKHPSETCVPSMGRSFY